MTNMPTGIKEIQNIKRPIRSMTLGGVVAVLTAMLPAVGTANTLEEVVVTAQKRSESLQETPISMQAFSESELEKRTAGDISQLAEFTPNVQFDFTSPISGASNAAVIFMRGVGQTDFTLTSEAGVGVYLDGIYLARSVGGVLDLMDIEQVEVLRGPQGTLFGKNTVGGAISVKTRQPGPEFEGAVSGTFGSDDRQDIKLSLNVPLVEDKLFLRLGAVSKNRDGFGKRTQTGETMGDMNSDTVRASLRWLVSDTADITINLDKTEADEDQPTTSLLKYDPTGTLADLYNFYAATGLINGPVTGPMWIDRDPFKSAGTSKVGSELDVFGASVVANFDIGDIQLKSVTGYRETESSFGRDTDHSPATVLHTYNEQDMDQFSQEFNFSGNSLDGALDWLLGLYYFTEEGTDLNDITIVPEIFAADAACAAVNCSGAGFGLGVRANSPLPLSVAGPVSIDNESKAIFLHGTYHFNDQLSSTFGLRYTEEQKKSHMPIYLADVNFPMITNPRSEQNFYDLSPRIGLEYQVNDDLFTYVSYSEGFKSGGMVARYIAPRNDLIGFEPEQVKSYEVGFKSDWADGRVRLNGAMFFADYKDIQVTVFNGIVPEMRNAAEGEIKGLELEFTSLISDQLMFSANFGYLDAEYTKLAKAGPGAVLEITKNHEFVNAPEWSGSLALEYTQPLDIGELLMRVDYSYQDEVAKDAANTPELIQDSYGLLNANIVLTTTEGDWELSLFGRNLNDEEYLVNGVSTTSFGIVEGTWGRPREVGLSVKYSF